MRTSRFAVVAILVVLLVPAIPSSAHEPSPDGTPEPTAQSLAWLAGDWVSVGVEGESELIEDSDGSGTVVSLTVSSALHDSITGVMAVRTGDDVASIWAISIAPRADNLLVMRLRALDGTLGGGSEGVVMHPLTSWSRDAMMFENETERMPRRVVFEHGADDDGAFRVFWIESDPVAGERTELRIDFRARDAAHAREPRILRVQLFRALLDAGDVAGAEALASDDPRRWWEAREGEGDPWDIGPTAGPWAAWDDHFKKRTETLSWEPGADGSVTVVFRELNDYYRLLERPWMTSSATYFFDDRGVISGLLIRPLGERDPGRTDEFLEWAREHEPRELQALMPGGEVDPGADHPQRFRALLNRWRRDVGMRQIHP